MRKFENCDVLSVLREIMSHNTKHYQTDFTIDEEILTEAIRQPNVPDRRYLWMSRPCGTHCLKEKDVFLFNSPKYNTWTAYADTADEIIAYAVQLNCRENGVLKGDLYELDYASHCAMAKNSAVYIAQVRLYSRERNIIMAYSDDWRLKAREYNCDKREFIPLSQNKLDTLLENMRQERLNGHYYPWDKRKLQLEYGDTPTYRIYQLKEDARDYLFLSHYEAKEKGLEINEKNYELVYIAENTLNYDPEEIFEDFNIDRPDDFCGHSLSMSDVIAYKHKDGSVEAYFVDNFGVVELQDFSALRRKNLRKCEVPMNVKLDGLTLHVEPDYNPPDPRTDCDHLGTMLCWHRNYIFGDQNRYDTPEDFYRSEEAKNIYVSLPVYMLDHSGTYLSTKGFSDVDPDRWDWGQIGIIYCMEEAAKKWFGYLPDKEMLKTQLNGEVECYNDYLNGNWYQYYIEGLNGDIEDSCGGFFQNGNFSDVLKDMKEYTERSYHPLFDKFVAVFENKNYM